MIHAYNSNENIRYDPYPEFVNFSFHYREKMASGSSYLLRLLILLKLQLR